jgi:lipid A 3-O-deacylase
LGEAPVKRAAYRCSLFLAGAAISASAHAGELFGGLYVHDVKLPTDLSGIEPGVDVMLGYRGGTIARPVGAALQPYVFGAINTAGQTSYAAVGLSARFGLGKAIYLRPGLGLAIHSGSAGRFFRRDEIAFGSRVLFEPELGMGTQVNDRLSIEASWVHMSHATLFSHENPGIDNLGFRLNLAL